MKIRLAKSNDINQIMDIIKDAKNYLKVPFNQMCLIDDSKQNIEVAKSLGMNGILFQGIEDLKEETT